MKFETKAKYPVSSDVIIKMFADPGFHTDKLKAMGIAKHRILEQKAEGGEFRIKIERKVPLDAPGMLKKFFAAETTVVSEERWNLAAKTGKVKVEPSGVPIEISCTAKMTDAGGQGTVNYTWEVRAKVPLIGGTLEKFVAGDMEKKLVDETKAAATLAGKYA